MLPEEMTIIGLDEKTALVIDLSRGECQVIGLGMVTLLHTGHKHYEKGHRISSVGNSLNITGTNEDLVKITKQRDGHFHQYQDGQNFSMSEIGRFQPYYPEACLPSAIWQKAIQAKHLMEIEAPLTPSEEVAQLIRARQEARQTNNWAFADELRIQIEKSGWEVLDTKDGPVSRKLPKEKSNN
jgi:cysteinyl-tRNA synthetase